MVSGYAEFSGLAHHEQRRTLHAFLLASLAAHAAIIVWLPDLLPRFDVSGVSVLEVTLTEPKPSPVPTVQPGSVPEPLSVRPEPRPAPRPETEKQRTETAARPAVGGPAPPRAGPEQDVEAAGSLAVAPSRGPAPVTAVPHPAAEAPRVTPPSFDPAYLSNPAPRYPQAARRAGEQGTVMLRVLVMREGRPSRVEIAKSSGSRLLDDAARDAVWGWRFAPARQGSDPVEAWLQVPVRFRLEDAAVMGRR